MRACRSVCKCDLSRCRGIVAVVATADFRRFTPACVFVCLLFFYLHLALLWQQLSVEGLRLRLVGWVARWRFGELRVVKRCVCSAAVVSSLLCGPVFDFRNI